MPDREVVLGFAAEIISAHISKDTTQTDQLTRFSICAKLNHCSGIVGASMLRTRAAVICLGILAGAFA